MGQRSPCSKVLVVTVLGSFAKCKCNECEVSNHCILVGTSLSNET